MAQSYYWRTFEDAALLLLLLGILGVIQIVLSYVAYLTLRIASPLLLAFVPLGIVLAQATAAALLANILAPVLLQPPQPHRPSPHPLRTYLLRFLVLLCAALIVLGIWDGFYGLYFITTPYNQPSYVVKYTVANTAGALIALIFSAFLDWLLTR